MYLSSGGIECYRSVEAVKAKVIALYAVVLSNANHQRQNVCRGEANRICGWTAPLLKPFRGSPSRLRLSFCSSGIRLFYERVRSFDSCETVSRRHRLYIRNRAFCSPRSEKRSSDLTECKFHCRISDRSHRACRNSDRRTE